MKALIVATGCLLAGNALAAGPIYLQCNVSSLTTDLSVTLNEATGKAAHTYDANGSGFTSDAQFTANEIIYHKKIARLGQSERFTIDRSTLAIQHAIFMHGNKVGGGNGTCKAITAKNNKI